ncbi:MATE family efflux transporter [Agathobaculum sp. Marseille-P7918]|uniref:MATE family efflux transporter n=1 Tax=Agathobaculum sp. Marseille-P7918 TaxID=2479843 RepID=UPI000F62C3A4|nr:MATE family efflux transporter [Agathobaculum sp. Marseille-P7918]
MDSFFNTKHLYRSYFKMALPVVLGLVVTLVYNLADTFFIAQTNDTNLIAGVSLCAPVFTALMAFGNIYGQGGSSLISRLLGEQDEDGVKRVSSFCFYIALATGIVLAVLMTAFNRPLLTLLGADANTLPHAFQYYIVLAVCAPIMVLSFIHSSLVRCEGMSTESMIGTVLGAVINIILDPILISVVGMGAMGAAVATVIGYFCSVLYFLWLLHKKSRCLSVTPSLCRVSSKELRQILGVGVTAALSNLMQSLCVIVVNQFLLPYGNDKIAAMGIVLKINMIAQLVLTGFAFGGVPLFGYLYGARQREEMKKLVRFCLGFMSALSLVLTAALCLFASPLMGAFVKDAAMIATGAEMLRWQAASTVFAGIVLLLTVLFQAVGKVGPSFVLSISRQGVVFVAALLVCVKLFAYNGVLMGQAVADVVSALIALSLLALCYPMAPNRPE